MARPSGQAEGVPGRVGGVGRRAGEFWDGWSVLLQRQEGPVTQGFVCGRGLRRSPYRL